MLSRLLLYFIPAPELIILSLYFDTVHSYIQLDLTNAFAIAKYDHHTIHTIINSSPILHVSCESEQRICFICWNR